MSDPERTTLQFRITLEDIEPPIWRLIEVPATYSFWDLHVAIQDAMGWLDYHLHAFRSSPRGGGGAPPIGIPDEDFDDDTLAGWEVPVVEHFREVGDAMDYEYDFGDGWVHRIELVHRTEDAPKSTLPRCLDGARACPPEDVGGVFGYQELLAVLADPSHRDYKEMVQWVSGQTGGSRPYRPEHFDPDAVDFWDPKERFRLAFE